MADEVTAEKPIDDAWADARAAMTELTKEPEVKSDAVEEKSVAPEKSEAPAPSDKADAKPEQVGRERDDQGRFVAKEGEKPAAEKPAASPVEAKPLVEAKAPEAPAAIKPASSPPPGWSVKSKSEWDKLPEHIRADIAKREEEVAKGFAEYSGMKELRPYVEMAQSQGITLKGALDRYLGIEDLLRKDVFKGLEHIASNYGLNRQQLAMYFAPEAMGIQTPDGQKPGQFDPSLLQQHLNPLAQELQGLKTLLTQQQQEQHNTAARAINNAIERFVADPAHRYYANVEDQMAQLIESGIVPRTGDFTADLQAAYDTACRLNPEIAELQLNERLAKQEDAKRAAEREAAEKAKQASRSLTSSPAGTVKEDNADDDDIHATVRKAYAQHAA